MAELLGAGIVAGLADAAMVVGSAETSGPSAAGEGGTGAVSFAEQATKRVAAIQARALRMRPGLSFECRSPPSSLTGSITMNVVGQPLLAVSAASIASSGAVRAV